MELRANNCGAAQHWYVITNLWYELACLLGYHDNIIHLQFIACNVVRWRFMLAF